MMRVSGLIQFLLQLGPVVRRAEAAQQLPLARTDIGATLLESEFAETVADLQHGILVIDCYGCIRVCNRAFVSVFQPICPAPGTAFMEAFPAADANLPPHAVTLRDAVLSLDRHAECLLQLPCAEGFEPRRLLLFAWGEGVDRTILGLLQAPDHHGNTRPGLSVFAEDPQEELRELRRANARLRIENAERRAVAQALRRAESCYRDIFDNATEGIFQWTPDWRLLSANKSFARMLGFSTVNAMRLSTAGRPFHFCCEKEVGARLVSELENRGLISYFELEVQRHDGTTLWAEMNARRVLGIGGTTSYYEAFIENITGRKSAEEKLLYQAFHDPLTGLANRALFLDRLRMAIRRAQRRTDFSFAVLYLDLDRFKIINDSLGHAAGDEVLCHASVIIGSCVREVDTVARFGGDEFAVLIEGAGRPTYAVQVARRIHASLVEPFAIRGQEVNIGASIGVVLKAEKYVHAEDILRDADTAMYRAKGPHKLCYCIFGKRMREETLESISLEADLRAGIKKRAFSMDYQPVVNLLDGTVHGFEALLRWNRNPDEVMSPNRFIPIAEDTGLIAPIGLHTLEMVLKQMQDWSDAGHEDVVIHVNISGKQLASISFARDVEKLLSSFRVNPALLRFEITESVLLHDTGACMAGMHQIRELGVHFCLDDFGTGFSSLSYLRRLPLSSIKIDRSFVADIETDPPSLVILRNLMALGEDLGLNVIVEGIERRSQMEFLTAAGCTLAQGYYFHRPLDPLRAGRLIAGRAGDSD